MKLLFILFSSWCLGSETIVAIMITGKDAYHECFAERAIESFFSQSYPHKQLLIVNDGEKSYRHLPVTEIKISKKLPLGALRNLALDQLPENALWMQWDDDDWHHPLAMEEHYAFLKKQKVDLCCMTRQIQYAFSRDAAWQLSRLIHGTVLARKKEATRYPEWTKGEDVCFIEEYAKKYRIAGWRNPAHYYVRFIHGHNTWEDSHFKLDEKTEGAWNISEEAAAYLASILPLYSNCVRE